MGSFSRIVRFTNPSDKIFYGEVPGSDLVTKETLLGSHVAVYNHTTPFDDDFKVIDQKEEIVEVRYRKHDELATCDIGSSTVEACQ